MIPQLLALVAVVLVLFEGKEIRILFTHGSGSDIKVVNDNSNQAGADTDNSTTGTTSSAPVSLDSDLPDAGLAGLTGTMASSISQNGKKEEAQTQPSDSDAGKVSEYIDSSAVVPENAPPKDDSYFANAVFIGDSRMEGFRNSSGITQGTFLTAVGLSSEDMGKQIISTPDGNISVYQGLSGRQYDRIYLMLGANDLGYYPWEMFQPEFEKVLKQFHELQPKATIYVCSVIYVDESKIAPGYEYNNNTNVKTINGYILSACENLWYCYYINLNEIFSNGYGSLISDASNDGIHLYPKYCEQMLAYLKSHYISDSDWEAALAAHPESKAASAGSASSDSGKDAANADGEDTAGAKDAGTASDGGIAVN